MTEVGVVKASHTYHWRIPDWSKLRPFTEYTSPPLYVDELMWSVVLYKGRPKSPDMLSLFVKLHEVSPGSLRGVRKKVQLTLKVHNTNPASYYNDFGVGKRLHPVWYSEKHTKWGEDALSSLESLKPFLNQNQASLSVTITILKSEMDTTVNPVAPGCSPFTQFCNSPEFSDIKLRVMEHESSSKSSSDDRNSDQDGKVIYGHKAILAAMSPWFRGLFSSGMQESFQDVITVHDVSPDIFERLVRYCYCFHIDIRSVRDAQALLEAADRFQIAAIRKETLRYLRQEISDTNVWAIWAKADMYDCEKTCKAASNYVAQNFENLIKHPSWLTAEANVIQMALQIEQGRVPEETKLYEAVLTWARHPHPNATSPKTSAPLKPHLEHTPSKTSCAPSELTPGMPGFELVTDTADQKQIGSVKVYHPKSLATTTTTATATATSTEPIDPDILERRKDLAKVLQYIRFPTMDALYLANYIETDDVIVNLDGVRDLLYEAYRFHAIGEESKTTLPLSFRCRPRVYVNED